MPMMESRRDTRREGRRSRLSPLATAFVLGWIGLAGRSPGADEGALSLRLRSRVEAPDAGGSSRTVEKSAAWDPKASAIIVCDMWDLHHSLNATLRLEEMAPRMDRMLR